MITKFKDWMWSQFPEYWHDNDTNKDVNGQGTAERLLETMGLEIDEEIVDKIDAYLDLLNAQETPEEFLVHISDALGNPPNVFLDVVKYRNILSYIVSVYKVKGTIKGYEAFFNLLGYDIVITEYPPVTVTFDNSHDYDEEDELNPSFYDSSCEPCSYYTIEFTTQDDDLLSPAPITEEILQKLRDAVYFVEPINAVLLSTTFAINLAEDVNLSIEENMVVQMLTDDNYDNSELFDDGSEFDDNENVIVFSF